MSTRLRSFLPCPLSLLLGTAIAFSSEEQSQKEKIDDLRYQLGPVVASQVSVDEVQRAAEQKLEFIKDEASDVLALQRAAWQAQQSANERQTAVRKILEELAKASRELDGFGGQYVRQKALIAECSETIPKTIEHIGVLEIKLAGTRKETQQIEAEHGRNKRKRNLVRNAKKALSGAERRLSNAKRNLSGLKKKLAKAVESEAKMRSAAVTRWRAIKQLKTRLLVASKEASKAQEAAREAQGAACTALRAQAKTRKRRRKSGEKRSTDGRALLDERDDGGIEKLDAAALYDRAVAIEGRITSSFVDARATELAMIRRISRDAAKRTIDIPSIQREGIKRALLQRDARTVVQMERYRAEARKALDQVTAMIERGQGLLEATGYGAEAEGGGDAEEENGSLSMVHANEAIDIAQALENDAVDDSEEWAKDLTDLMNQAYAQQGGAAGGTGEDGEDGAGEEDGTGGEGGTGEHGAEHGSSAGAGGEGGTGEDCEGHETGDGGGGEAGAGEEGEGDGVGDGAGGQGGTGEHGKGNTTGTGPGGGEGGYGKGKGKGTGNGPAGDSNWGNGKGDGRRSRHTNPYARSLGRRTHSRGNGRRKHYYERGENEDVAGMFAAVPGRRVQAGLGGHPWMYVDSWYLIGPFPNEGRRYLHHKFPPETVIDLDAVYKGKGGKEVRWKHVVLNKPGHMIPTSYCIYYAYTELWFDEPREMWVALGTDDGSRLYINDMLVWRTVRGKAWRINEAYRKVSFKKGLNRILYRVENAWVAGFFSFLLHVNPHFERKTAEVTEPQKPAKPE